MVRTAVRTIILSVCKVPDTAVSQFVSGSSALPEALVGSLRADYAALLTLLSAAHRPEAVVVESTVAPDKTASATAATTASATAATTASAAAAAAAHGARDVSQLDECLQASLSTPHAFPMCHAPMFSPLLLRWVPIHHPILHLND